MKTKALFFAALIVAFSSTARADEIVHSLLMSNGEIVLSSTAPVPSGSMLLVKNLSDGSLRAVPAELVSNVSKARATGTALAGTAASRLVTNTDFGTSAKSVIVLPTAQKASRKLTSAKMTGTLTSAGAAATLAGGKPVTLAGSLDSSKAQASLTRSVMDARAIGFKNETTIFLGPTGGTSAFATRADTTVVSPRGSGATSIARAPFSASIQDQIFVGDLPRLTPRSGLAAGMVTPTAGEVEIGPNGFPVPVSATTPARAVPIGPNGFPDFTAATTSEPVGPNGFPATGVTAPTRALTPAGAALSGALPVTVSAATTATAGAISAPGAATAPAAASPR